MKYKIQKAVVYVCVYFMPANKRRKSHPIKPKIRMNLQISLRTIGQRPRSYIAVRLCWLKLGLMNR